MGPNGPASTSSRLTVQATAATIVATEKERSLGEQVQRLKSDLLKFPEQERQLADLQQRADLLNRTFNLLSERYYTLLIEERSSLPSGMVAAEARAAKSHASPRVVLNLVFAFVFAFAISGVGFDTITFTERLEFAVCAEFAAGD